LRTARYTSLSLQGFAWYTGSKGAIPAATGELLFFGLSCRTDSPRAAAAAAPYPNRRARPVIVLEAAQPPGAQTGWLREAHDFARAK